ncbi:hypothetical protein JTB14_030993 [Gonioctena quinquepunctata]|nr:hypothetical protein JTB14_030993 [Gonioctena quinquepunctata]
MIFLLQCKKTMAEKSSSPVKPINPDVAVGTSEHTKIEKIKSIIDYIFLVSTSAERQAEAIEVMETARRRWEKMVSFNYSYIHKYY